MPLATVQVRPPLVWLKGQRVRQCYLLRTPAISPGSVRKVGMRIVPGDQVAVVATSGPVVASRLRSGVSRLRSWGLRVRVAPHAETATGYLAGTDEARASDFTEAWCDPEVSAVFCARGGYGAQRMLDLIDWDQVRAAGPKAFIGSSDATALHQALARRLGQITYFGPMVATPAFNKDKTTAETLRTTLFDGVESLSAPGATALVSGSAEGVLHGGTLSMLASAIGTSDGGPLAGPRVLFLEDLKEPPYRLDRCLTQLLRSGWFTGVTGVVLGTFLDCGEEALVRATLLDRLEPLEVPVLWGIPAGHGPTQLTLPFGAHAALDADAGTLRLLARPDTPMA